MAKTKPTVGEARVLKKLKSYEDTRSLISEVDAMSAILNTFGGDLAAEGRHNLATVCLLVMDLSLMILSNRMAIDELRKQVSGEQ